jgi:hypothetical protein
MAFVFTTTAPALSAEAAESVGDVSACAIEPPADFQSYFKGRRDVAWRFLTVGATAASIGAVQTLTTDDCGRIQAVTLTKGVSGGYTGSAGVDGGAAVLFLPPIDETIGAEIDIVLASVDTATHSLIIASPGGANIVANIGFASMNVTATNATFAMQALFSGNTNVCIQGAGAQIHCVNLGAKWYLTGNASLVVATSVTPNRATS